MLLGIEIHGVTESLHRRSRNRLRLCRVLIEHELVLADEDFVAVLQDVARNRPPVDERAVGASQVLEDHAVCLREKHARDGRTRPGCR